MIKAISTTILCTILLAPYTLAYAVSHVLKLKDRDLMDTPADFFFLGIDEYYADQVKWSFTPDHNRQ